jgi:xanthine dehydrogenase small subunit
MPPLIALGASVVLRSARGARTLPLEDLYIGYQQKAMAADEIVEAVDIPARARNLQFRTYKVSKRYDSDISAVCAAFAIWPEGERSPAAGSRSAEWRDAQTRRSAEAAMSGQPWTEATATKAAQVLAGDYRRCRICARAAGYRLQVAQNLLTRCWLETRPDVPCPRPPSPYSPPHDPLTILR